jgi:hypothetical protein
VIENEDSSVERRTVHHTTELDGQYHLDAAAVCRPGLAISGEIQRVTGHAAFRDWRVPHYVAKLQKSMNRFLKVLTPERPVEQNNVRHANHLCKRTMTDWIFRRSLSSSMIASTSLTDGGSGRHRRCLHTVNLPCDGACEN